MKTNAVVIVSAISAGSLFLSSCDTPVGQGAAWALPPARSSAVRRLAMCAPHQLAQRQEPPRAL